MDKKRGRPLGSTKNGKKTPKKQLDILRTKAWASHCARLIGGDQPAGAGRLASAANAWAHREEGIAIPGYCSAGWSRWLRGERGAKPRTVLSLWPAAHDAYFVGPPAEAGHDDDPAVPLWAALSGAEEAAIAQQWAAIPLSAWAGWAPLIIHAPDAEYPCGYCLEDSDFIPNEKLTNSERVYAFCSRLLASPRALQAPPLVWLAAAITFARLDDIHKIYLLENENDAESSSCLCMPPYPPAPKKAIATELEKYNISLDEITNHGLCIIGF